MASELGKNRENQILKSVVDLMGSRSIPMWHIRTLAISVDVEPRYPNHTVGRNEYFSFFVRLSLFQEVIRVIKS